VVEKQFRVPNLVSPWGQGLPPQLEMVQMAGTLEMGRNTTSESLLSHQPGSLPTVPRSNISWTSGVATQHPSSIPMVYGLEAD